jgi:hypothetical protein
MFEFGPGLPLNQYLTADYTPEERPAVLDVLADNPDIFLDLSPEISLIPNPKVVETRFASEESSAIGHSVEELLTGTHITDSFKKFIVYEVRRAHANETHVSDEIAPDRLGLTIGPGIFDADAAVEIEAQCIRGRLASIVESHVVSVLDDEGRVRPAIQREPEFLLAWQTMMDWITDYVVTTKINPFKGINLNEMLSALAGEGPEADEDERERDFREELEGLKGDQPTDDTEEDD